MHKKIGFIGAGNMGTALMSGARKARRSSMCAYFRLFIRSSMPYRPAG